MGLRIAEEETNGVAVHMTNIKLSSFRMKEECLSDLKQRLRNLFVLRVSMLFFRQANMMEAKIMLKDHRIEKQKEEIDDQKLELDKQRIEMEGLKKLVRLLI